MNDKINMDKHIREKLDGFSVAPPPHVWNNIQGQMAGQLRKKRIAYIGWISAAAVVVFAFMAGWFFNEKSREDVLPLAEQEIVQPKTEEEPGRRGQEEAVLKPEKVKVGRNEKLKPIEYRKSRSINVARLAEDERETETTFAASFERMNYTLMERVEAIFKIEKETVLLAEYKMRQSEEFVISSHDEILIAANVKNIERQKTGKKGWIIGAHVSPGYSSHSANHGEQYSQNMTYSADNGIGNVGGGLSVQYKTSKRLRVESGVYFSQNGQSSNSSAGGLFSFDSNADYLYAAPENIDEARTGFQNSVQLNNNGIAMNSTAGVINMRATPKGASIATNAENSDANFANTLVTNGEFSQEFEFVEVPLYIRYSILDKKFGIELMGGLNAGFVVGNNAYIDNDFGKQNIGSTEDISTLNLSGTIGVGLNYMMGKHFSLAVEPRLNYYLNSINTNPDVSYRPYRIGVFTGLYYEF